MRLLVAVIVASVGMFQSLSAQAAHTRVTYPSAVSVEILGRSMLYTVAYDQVLNDDLAVGVGLGTVSLNFRGTDTDAGKSATMIPVYMNYYFMKEGGSPFLTGGVTLITNHSSVKNLETTTGGLEIPSSNVMPTFGGGYENRGDNGFLFRIAAYAVAGRSLTPWMGFSFGYSF